MLHWLSDLSNSKVLALLLFFPLFLAIVIYVMTGRQRKERLESHKFIPFADHDPFDEEADNDDRNQR